ncbi:MAG: oligosaccharide flippase family protein [candidate division Zixibacteria bacterium]|nr:oligosaccharide flippase family protein [candidate division Zixibacteria bacterium]
MTASSVKSEGKLLLKHSAIYGMATGVQRMLGFVMIPLYTSYLAPADYGVMELLYMTTSLIEMVVGIGIAHGVVRFYFESDIQTERNKVISSAFLGMGGLLLPTVLLLIFSSSTLSFYVLDSREYTSLFVLAFASMGLGMLNQVNLSYLRAEKRSLLVVASSVGQMLLNLGLNVYFIVVMDMGVAGIFWGNLISVAVTMAVVTPMVLRRVGIRFSFDVVKGLVKFGLPLIPSNIANYIVVASDRWFIKEYVSISETGIYSLGYKFGSLVNNFVTSPFNQIYGPRRMELFRQDESHALFGRVFTYFVLIITVVGLGISLVSRDLVRLMADEAYWDAYKIIPLVTLAHIALAFFYHVNIGITITKKTKYFMYINVMNGLLNIGLNILLIPMFGIWGAAWSTLICYTFRSGLGYYFSRKLVNTVVEWTRVFVILGLAAVVFFVFERIELGNIYLTMGVKGLICCCFPLALYCGRFFSAEERSEIRSLLAEVLAKVGLRK